jgi:hypothetical protein
MRCQAVEGQVTLRPMADNDAARPRATLLLTRPRAASERFSAEIIRRDLPLDIVIAPLMEIVATDPPPPLPVGAELIFTSSNAVGLAGRGAGQRAWCVGARTASAATQAGFDGVVAGFSADDLVALLNDERPGARLVHLRGRHQRGDVADRLAAAGLSVTSHVVYEQVAVPARCVLHRGADQSAASRARCSPPEARNCSRRRQGHRGSRVRIGPSRRSARRFGPFCRGVEAQYSRFAACRWAFDSGCRCATDFPLAMISAA